MDELRLRKVTIRTRNAGELENFLVEVLGAEITYGEVDSFVAEVGGVSFAVCPGIPAADTFEFSVSAQFLADLSNRWEFFCFRRGAKVGDSLSKTTFSCTDFEGRTWSVFVELPLLKQNTSDFVRNC